MKIFYGFVHILHALLQLFEANGADWRDPGTGSGKIAQLVIGVYEIIPIIGADDHIIVLGLSLLLQCFDDLASGGSGYVLHT